MCSQGNGASAEVAGKNGHTYRTDEDQLSNDENARQFGSHEVSNSIDKNTADNHVVPKPTENDASLVQPSDVYKTENEEGIGHELKDTSDQKTTIRSSRSTEEWNPYDYDKDGNKYTDVTEDTGNYIYSLADLPKVTS